MDKFTSTFGEDLIVNFEDIAPPKEKKSFSPNKKFEPIPAGIYTAEVINEEIKTSKKGNKYLSLRFQITEGPYNGRLVFETLNLFHPNDKVKKIAESRLKELCDAIGMINIKQLNFNKQNFMNKTCLIEVIIEVNEEYGDKNKITSYISKEEHFNGHQKDDFPF